MTGRREEETKATRENKRANESERRRRRRRRRRRERTKRVYCVTKNGAARCARHDTAIRLELRFFSPRCQGHERESARERWATQRRYFGSRRWPKTGSPRVDKENPARPVVPALVVSLKGHTCYVARVYARKPGLPDELS